MFVTISSFNLRLKLRWIALLLSVLVAACATMTHTIPPDKSVIKLTPKFGPVTFSHQRHSELETVGCVTCHHTMESNDESIRSCYSCHEAKYYSIARIKKADSGQPGAEKTEPQVPYAQQAFHGLCVGCHQVRRAQKLPTGPDKSCRDCHK